MWSLWSHLLFHGKMGKESLKKKKRDTHTKKMCLERRVNNDNLLFLMKFDISQIIELFGLLTLTFVLCPPLLFGFLSK